MNNEQKSIMQVDLTVANGSIEMTIEKNGEPLPVPTIPDSVVSALGTFHGLARWFECPEVVITIKNK